MDKKTTAIILREYRAHTPHEIARLVQRGLYQAHWTKDGNCRHACGRVADEYHPLRGWHDYNCPYCGRRVRTVFSPSAGGGITRYYGLTHPDREVWVEVCRNSFSPSGVQIDLVDSLGEWIVDFHHCVKVLARMAREHTADFVRIRAGSYRMLVRVVFRPMRTLVVIPSCLLPPELPPDADNLVETRISWWQASSFRIEPEEKVYIIPEKTDKYRVLSEKPLSAVPR